MIDSEESGVEQTREAYRRAAGRRHLSRRTFLRRVAAAVGLGGVSYGVIELSSAGASDRRPSSAVTGHRRRRVPPAPRPVQLTALPGGAVVPTATWVQNENSRPGTIDWVVTGHQVPRAIEGFADVTSAVAGSDVTLFVNTVARSFHVEAYRMGYYQGLGARLIWTSDDVGGVEQPPPTVSPSLNTVQCSWAPSLSVPIDASWPPGSYLLKLVGDFGEQQYIPLCVRDDASTAAFVVQHGVTTWQAYNLWGGYSLYNGLTAGGLSFGQSTAGKDFDHRSRVVSFDRPFSQDWAQGASDFIGNEFPLIFHMESLGLDVTYWTDVDLHERPELLVRHRCLFSLGHDEYWSLQMRDAAVQGLDLGVNLGFLGANACYRQIRLESSPIGPNRLQVCYKSAADDPLYGVDDAVVTGPEWSAPPTSWPESQLIGSMYQDVGADADLVVADPSSWVWAGTGVAAGQKFPNVIQGEYDRFDSALPGPRNVEIAAHSPVANRGPGRFSDMTWYTAYGGGGVFATGNASWVNKLSQTTAFPDNVVPAAIPGVTETLLRVMENVYAVLGVGLGSANQPSRENWSVVAPVSGAPGPEPTVAA
ncbi:MAG TPA: N,N-dimethylformamidase beta subunit family domain-containing protein [Acidimicrobiales bacterium]|nr:N,N-dimethylformamidase beta subunit family domain-containing protein [Acidimicrobiales bacterium]